MNVYRHYTSLGATVVGFLKRSLGFKSSGLKKDGELYYIFFR